MNSENTELRSAHKALCHGAPPLKLHLLPKSPSRAALGTSPWHPWVGTSTWPLPDCGTPLRLPRLVFEKLP